MNHTFTRQKFQFQTFIHNQDINNTPTKNPTYFFNENEFYQNSLNQYVVDLYLKEVQESISKLILQMIKTFGNIL